MLTWPGRVFGNAALREVLATSINHDSDTRAENSSVTETSISIRSDVMGWYASVQSTEFSLYGHNSMAILTLQEMIMDA